MKRKLRGAWGGGGGRGGVFVECLVLINFEKYNKENRSGQGSFETN